MAINESKEDEWGWMDLDEIFVVDFVGWNTFVVHLHWMMDDYWMGIKVQLFKIRVDFHVS